MARKIVFVRGEEGCVMVPAGRKLGIDAKVDCVIKQNGKEVLLKEDCDTTLDGDAIILELTEEETIKLEAEQYGELQIRYVTDEDKGLLAIQVFEVRENLFGEVSGKKAGFIHFGIVEDIPASESDVEKLDVSKSVVFTVPRGRYCIACRKEIVSIVGDGGYDYINDFEKSIVGGFNVYTLPHKATEGMKFMVELKGGIKNA
ncbi:MAG: hypothetical protein IKU60_03750 [Clostridia bacterium]|nr:hypothetical protein [Clostridia bacterium]